MKRLCVFDEDQDFIKLLKKHLEAFEYEITVCRGGGFLEETLSNASIDLLIMARHIPPLGALPLIKVLRKSTHSLFQNMPVLIYGLRTPTAVDFRIFQNYRLSYISKFATFDRWAKKVTLILEGSS